MQIKKIISQIKTGDKYLTIPIGFTAVSSLTITLAFLLIFNQLPQNVPLFYSLPWGSGQLASKQQLLILPSIMVLVALINVAIYSQLHISQLILKRMLLINILVANFILTFVDLKIIFSFL